jgi:alanyl-tRNA synthetase
MITFGKDYSIELCGGTHVKNTSQITVFKILNETAVAAGVRRIEAITSNKVLDYFKSQEDTLKDVLEILHNPKDVVLALQKIKEENLQLKSKLEEFETKELLNIKTTLKSKFKSNEKGVYLVEKIEIPSVESLKNLCFQLKNEISDSFGVLGTCINNKPMLAVFVSDTMLEHANANKWIKELAPMIKGGGGGQVFYANAGGTDIQGLEKALQHAEQSIHTGAIPK